ncbi:response regulator [Sphingosinicella rhizophila]|uniref:Response regulator n=1 Tax=Sphingosinicella rhizophila TaxID=3050082 RepID=A0ABU3Q7T0_9SPHN|nr:response regulator [Sphingosinicella sp. GR2756]MDT9599005.1 response regulator [Sphingosinicella sp. GR2756]
MPESSVHRVRPRILLVEDDSAVRRSLQLLLQAQGLDVRAYRSAVGLASDPEALKAVCMVSDLLLPDEDGMLLLQEMRRAGWTGPAILISGHLTDEWAAKAMEQGFAEILEKPIAERRLIDCIARLLTGSGAGNCGRTDGPCAP